MYVCVFGGGGGGGQGAGSEADVKAALLKMHPTLAMFRADETPAAVTPPSPLL